MTKADVLIEFYATLLKLITSIILLPYHQKEKYLIFIRAGIKDEQSSVGFMLIFL
jgi:hypothetical protein